MKEKLTSICNAVSRIEVLIKEGQYLEAQGIADAIRPEAHSLPSNASARADFDYADGTVAYHLRAYDTSVEAFTQCVRARREFDDPIELAEALRNLGASTRASGDNLAAERLYEEAKAILFEAFPDGDARVADLLGNLSVLYYMQSRLAESEDACRQALEMRRSLLGPEDEFVGQSLSNLGEIILTQGRLPEAERYAREGLTVREQALPPNHPDIAASLNNLSVVLYEMGRYSEAEDVQRRALGIDTIAFGAGSLDVAIDLQNLAEIEARQKRLQSASETHRKVLSIRRSEHTNEHADVALSLSNLANVLDDLGESQEARDSYSEAIAIEERIALGKPSIGLASVLNNVGDLERREKQYPEALTFFERALKALPEPAQRSRLHTSIINNIADLQLRLRQASEAELRFAQVVEIRSETLPSDHPDLIHSLARLADATELCGDQDRALMISRKAIKKLRHRLEFGSAEAPAVTTNEARMAKEALITHLGLLATRSTSKDIQSEIFDTAQMTLATDTAVAMSRMAERHALSSSDASAQVIELQQLSQEEASLTRSLDEAVSVDKSKQPAKTIVSLRNQLASVKDRLDYLRSAFPDVLRRMYGFEAISLQALQSALEPDEALIVALCGQTFSVLMLVETNCLLAKKIAATRSDMAELCDRIRASTDLSGGQKNLPAFDVEAAIELRNQILAPFTASLIDKKHIISNFDEPLASVPLSVYPDFDTPNSESSKTRPKQIDTWLVDRAAITMVPSPVSLISLRARAGQSKSPNPFLGFGAPDVSGLELVHLPRAEQQLEAIRNSLQSSEDSVVLGTAANKNAVRSTEARSAKVLAFATHGLMADETAASGGPREPSLLLSGSSPDCFLTASEIAQLRLDADWVVLSACNTATSSEAGAEGLSGLARSFFEAGARTVLISHWAVSEFSTTSLLQKLFSSNPAIGKAERLRQAMVAVRDSGFLSHAHPAYWAAFTLVGEGWHVSEMS